MTTDESTTAVAEETLRASTTSDNQSSAFLTPGPRPSAPSVEVLRVPAGTRISREAKIRVATKSSSKSATRTASATD